jgi:chromosome segregation ATPase
MEGELLMKRLFMAFVLISLSLCPYSVMAKDSVPRSEFIKYTEEALNALDEVEVVFSSSESSKYEAEKALKSLDIAIKKYERFDGLDWGKTNENKIAWEITYSSLNYNRVLLEGLYGSSHEEAKKLAQGARSLFQEYKKVKAKRK